ncbi:MAG: GTP 3',8-cyclase MoaA [Clostridiales Family XIII bacterium]|uniref:GTP 3',8-cyclase MoaA n=1 Tax=Hominibacterium faecale TaxID=2839743 RepID=UPI0022B2A8B3|nr:GTP 3',8-cyclase MoaA [Hominibacterium faecale]MCI7302235.1 GTP 3',8-cyclase MoaA [Clostridia bacterium]MDY3009701.1 GTP 3',8-cyclase MoaA [Clostridiales Family XIII bacterium]
MKDQYNRDINYMRVSVTELCNLRCRYCMPEEGIAKKAHEEMMTAEETIMAVSAAARLGIRKIRITGGEPLVKRGIVKLCGAIADIPGIEEVCITTNGTLLPKYAKDLKAAGVDRLNISLDTLNPEKYHHITRLGELSDALAGLKAAEDVGFTNIKINNVLMGGFNDDETEDFVNLTREQPIEVRFIELMPIGGGIGFDRAQFVSCDTVLEKVPQLRSLNREEGVARLYALPGAAGRVGLIRPVSCDFCEGCNKIRLTADGKLKPCLHSDQEISLKGLNEDQMEETLRGAIMDKPQKREELGADSPSKAGRDMNQIGG